MRPFVLESRLLCAYVFALAAFNAGTAGAAYPDRPIRYIVPSAAGGGATERLRSSPDSAWHSSAGRYA